MEIKVERDPWIALDGGPGATSDGANVVRIPLKRPMEVAESVSLERDVAEAGNHFIHLIDEIAEAVAKNTAHSETLARRAVTALQKAEARVRELEALLAKTELRATQSDQLIARLQTILREKYGRFASPSSAA